MPVHDVASRAGRRRSRSPTRSPTTRRAGRWACPSRCASLRSVCVRDIESSVLAQARLRSAASSRPRDPARCTRTGRGSTVGSSGAVAVRRRRRRPSTRACSPSTGSARAFGAAEQAPEEVEEEHELEREHARAATSSRTSRRSCEPRRAPARGSSCSRRCGGGRPPRRVMNSGMKMKLNGMIVPQK